MLIPALLRRFILALAFVMAPPAAAEVKVHFHSFNGSVLLGRYPHAFISLSGTLRA